MVSVFQCPSAGPANTFAPLHMNRFFPSHLVIALAMTPIAAWAQNDTKVFVPYSQQKPVDVKAAAPTPTVASLRPTPGDSGQVTIHESARIQGLMKDYASTKQPLKGYRVQIFLGDRNKAEEIRRSFLVKHPDTPAYLDYLAPNFRVRVGDQRTKLDGEKLKQALLNEFPGLYVVPCEIEMPRLPEGN